MTDILRPNDPRDIRAAKFEIEKKDTFHLLNLYEFAHDWLSENDWVDVGNDVDDDTFEHYYYEKRSQSGKREYRFWWRLKKFPIDNDYFRYVLLIDWQPLSFEKVQVVHKGEKVETWKGDLTMHIESWLQVDYHDRWRDHWLMQHVEKLYRNRIWKKQRDRWKKDLWGESYALASWLKKFLDMKSPYKQPDNFHPEKGVGPTPKE